MPADPADSPPAVEAAAAAEDDDRECRYCFSGPEEGPLLSPCDCAGGQKWVHQECLRRWQRSVLVSQPTKQGAVGFPAWSGASAK